jgi:hypothetical protein
MQPSAPQLNIDWRLSPQQEQAMSVERGIDKISLTINDVVKQKREEDNQYNNNLREIIGKTSGQYQSQMYDIIEQSKERLKAAGSNGWKNSKELLSAREEVLRDLTLSSQKANYVSVRVPQLYELINKDLYADKELSIKEIQKELSKGIKDLDVSKIESVYLNPEYKNMTAIMRDALDVVVGERMYTSEPTTKLDGDVYNIYQYQYKGNLKQIKNADGTTEMVPTYNVYRADGSLDEEETSLKKREFVDQVFDAAGSREKMLKYFDDYFTKRKAPQLNGIQENDGAARERIIKELAADMMTNTVGAYDYKYLGSREKDNYISKQITLLNLKNNFMKQQINERAQEFYDELQRVRSGDDVESAKSIIKNRIETTIGGAGDYIIATSEDEGWVRLSGDRIVPISFLKEQDAAAEAKYEKDKRAGKNPKYPDLYLDENGNLWDRAKKEGAKPFTGIAYRKGKDILSKEYVSFGFDWNDPKALSRFAVDWTNSTFNKNAATYDVITSDGTTTGSGLSGGNTR